MVFRICSLYISRLACQLLEGTVITRPVGSLITVGLNILNKIVKLTESFNMSSLINLSIKIMGFEAGPLSVSEAYQTHFGKITFLICVKHRFGLLDSQSTWNVRDWLAVIAKHPYHNYNHAKHVTTRSIYFLFHISFDFIQNPI